MYLDDEIGNDPPILGMHPGPVSVEDPCDPDLDPGPLVVGVGQGLRHPLALVVAGPGANGVDIPPVGLGLGMNIRVLRAGSHLHGAYLATKRKRGATAVYL